MSRPDEIARPAAPDWRDHIAAARAQADALPRPTPPRMHTDDAANEIDPVTVPGYNLVRRISRGGQGTVFEALRSATQRRVAVKLFKLDGVKAEADRARFEREVTMLQRVRDPRIVTVHEHGYIGSRAFFVMDFIEGLPLDEYLSAKARPLRRIIELFAEICEAVDAAHDLGVVHRDLKPANILIDEEGRPYVLDFGLARPVRPRGASGLTRAGEFVGSLLWAAPEQLEADPSAVSSATDVYSLGVVLYQALTGQFPYALGGDAGAAAESIRTADPVRPSVLHPQLSETIEQIILRALRKDPAQRYSRAGALAAELRGYLADPASQTAPQRDWHINPAPPPRRDSPMIITSFRRMAESLLGAILSSEKPVDRDLLAHSQRSAGAVLLLMAAAQLLVGIIAAGMISAAFAARDPAHWVHSGFDLLIVGAYISFVPAALGVLLLRPFDTPEPGARLIRWMRIAPTTIGIFAVLAIVSLLHGRQALIDLLVISLAIVPAAILLDRIHHLLRRHGDWRRAGQARWQLAGLVVFGMLAVLVLGMRSSSRVVEEMPHILLIAMAITIALGMSLAIASTLLLAGLYRVLGRATNSRT